MISDHSDEILLFWRIFFFPYLGIKFIYFFLKCIPLKYAFCFAAFSVGFPILLKFPMSAKKPG